MSVRYGHSWPSGYGRRSWVSMPVWFWLLGWWLLLPFIAVVAVGWAVVWLCWQLLRLTTIAVLLLVAAVQKWQEGRHVQAR